MSTEATIDAIMDRAYDFISSELKRAGLKHSLATGTIYVNDASTRTTYALSCQKIYCEDYEGE